MPSISMPEKAKQSDTLRLVVWNIQQGGGTRANELLAQLAAWQPDLCVLLDFANMETSRVLRNRLGDAGLTHREQTVDYRSAPDIYGLLIASRWPLEVLDVELDGAPPHRWRLVRVNRPSPLTLGAVQVTQRSERPGHKYRCLAALGELALTWSGDPGLLVGDFGSGQPDKDEEVPYFNAREAALLEHMAAAGWTDAFRQQHPDERRFSWCRRLEGALRGLRVDHAFLSPELVPYLQQCELLSTTEDWPSDHAALLLDLKCG